MRFFFFIIGAAMVLYTAQFAIFNSLTFIGWGFITASVLVIINKMGRNKND